MHRLCKKKRVIKLFFLFSFGWFLWQLVVDTDQSEHIGVHNIQKSNSQLVFENKEDQHVLKTMQPKQANVGSKKKAADLTEDDKPEQRKANPNGNISTKEKMESHNKRKTEAVNINNAPGEQGKGINIDVKSLTPEEKKRYDEGWKNNAFNEYVSDMISLDRSVEDTRDPECKTMTYNSNLPDASVIVTFHNEAWSVLLRSIHSIINRTPPELLKEVILVDDFSDMPHLHAPLEEYMSGYGNGKIKILRASKREGLIRSRLLGYSVATGAVLVYLDSHIECMQGWIEPLLDPIGRNKTIVVTPMIDNIDYKTLQYRFIQSREAPVGGFDWSLTFTWHHLPESERARRNFKDYLPARSPTMAGGLFAISREYFTHIGTYDEGMNIWGAENLEISFRIWMCGGTLLTVPCSHVGHIFRKHSPYSWPGKNILLRNNLRMAEVWLDDFKTYYYSRVSQQKMNETDYGDISQRKALRKRLNCKSFAWYLQNVFPEMYIPGNSIASGEIRNKAKPICLDGMDDSDIRGIVKTYPCHRKGGNQFWLYMKDYSFRRDVVCFDYFKPEKHIQLLECHGEQGNQRWDYRADNTIYHVNTELCITLSFDSQSVTMEECRGTDNQLWIMERKPLQGPLI